MDSKAELEKLRYKRAVSNSPFNSPALRPKDVSTTPSPLLRPTVVPTYVPAMAMSAHGSQTQSQKQSFNIHEDQMREIPDSAEEDNNDLIVEFEDMEQLDSEEQTVVPDNYDEESDYSEESEEEVDPAVQEDMEKFQATFKGIKERFRLINRIGEGTFSTVYKAEDLCYDEYDNTWDIDEQERISKNRWSAPGSGGLPAQRRRRPRIVAIKQIYVTSSPSRIFNELDLLKDLRNCASVCPLITAVRCTDQVVAVLPYFKHTDFREYFRKMTIEDCKIYFRSIFTALAAVHEKGILHRDIKPTNFLYEPSKKRGVLVDFGLAEREGTDSKPCMCSLPERDRQKRIRSSAAALAGASTGYPKSDIRPSRRANRAGTRGFRAPEVLFKCTAQTTAIDVWSVGVILLTILSKRFPFFNSSDDVEAMIEIATIFGTKKMKQCAVLHGTVFETNIPTIGQQGFSWEKIVLWSTCRVEGDSREGASTLDEKEQQAVSFLDRCLDWDPSRRISARDALRHEFLREDGDDEYEEQEDELDMI